MAFTLDKIHDSNLEALVYCKRGEDICLPFPMSGTGNHVHARSRQADLLRVREKKHGNQKSTAIKVNSFQGRTV